MPDEIARVPVIEAHRWGARLGFALGEHAPERGRCSDDYEHRCDVRLDGDDEPTSVGDREADVDGHDQCETERVHRRRIEPPEDERRRCLDSAPDDPPDDRPAHLPTLVDALQEPHDWGISHGSTSNPNIIPLS